MPSFLLIVFGGVLAAAPHIIVTSTVDQIAQITADMTELGAVWMSDSSQSTPSGSRSVSPIRIVHVQNPLRVPPSPTYEDFSHSVPTDDSENIPEAGGQQQEQYLENLNSNLVTSETVGVVDQELLAEVSSATSSDDTELPPPPTSLSTWKKMFLIFTGFMMILSIAFAVPAALNSF